MWLVVNWPVAVTVIFSAVAAGFSLIVGNWRPMLSVLFPTILKVIEVCSASPFVGRRLAKWLLPKIDTSIDRRILKTLRKAECPHQEIIVQQVKEQTKLWMDCKKLSES